MNYQRKQKGWARALKTYLATNPPRISLRPLDLPFETRLEMARNQDRRSVPILVGREFDLLMVWEHARNCVCLCACGRPVEEVSANGLLNGTVKDCGHRAKEAQRIKRYRKAQKAKQRAKDARADRKRVRSILNGRKRKPARKFWKGWRLAA
jgi:hypothetical protein